MTPPGTQKEKKKKPSPGARMSLAAEYYARHSSFRAPTRWALDLWGGYAWACPALCVNHFLAV